MKRGSFATLLLWLALGMCSWGKTLAKTRDVEPRLLRLGPMFRNSLLAPRKAQTVTDDSVTVQPGQDVQIQVVSETTAEEPEPLQKSGMVAQTQYDQYGAVVATPQQAAQYTGPNLVYPQNMGPAQYTPPPPPPMSVAPQATPGQMTYDDADTLINILDAINNIYNYYYEILPDQMNGTAPTNTTAPTLYDQQQMMTVMNFYQRIRSFVHTVVYNRHNLYRDLSYFEAKTNTLGTSEQDMLAFYGLQFTYYQLKSDSNPLLATHGKQINAEFDTVARINAEYAIDVRNILAGAFDLARLNEYFQSEIDVLGAVGYRDPLMNALDKFDKVVMFVVRLVEIKMDIQKSLSETERSLLNCKGYRMDLEQALMKVQAIVDEQRMLEARAKMGGVGLVSLLVSLLLAALFLA